MTIHLQAEIERLKKKILHLGAVVEDSLRSSIRALINRDPKLAQGIIDHDEEIDRMEVELEEDCLKALALHQPVAIDLRFIVAILKINSDLERIADLAGNICGRVIFIAGREEVELEFDFKTMAQKVERMVQHSLDALVNRDPQLARQVCADDEEVDEMHRNMFKQVEKGILKQPRQIETFFSYMSASRNLERIADHATNIAEDVIYMVEGEIVRHRLDEIKP